METVASFIRDDTGNVIGIHGVSRDITDRKQAERLLQISQKKFAAAFHDNPAPMVITDSESGKIIEANQSFLAKTGYSVHEVIDYTSVDLGVGKRERDKLVREVRDKGKVDSWEYKYRIKGGDIRDVLHSARLIEIDNWPCIISHFNDITDLRRVEEELKKHRDHLEELVSVRTAELTETYEQLKQENELRGKTEAALRSRESELERERHEVEDVNAALKVLLKHREDDRTNTEKDIVSNIKINVMPFIQKLEASSLKKSQKTALSMIKTHLNDIASPFIRKISSEYLRFTPSEIKVASLIREGKTSKDIAEILNISLNTVITHRYNIRKKTRLRNKKMNLRSYLQTLERT
jgi:PAS domain S-box-containing protein